GFERGHAFGDQRGQFGLWLAGEKMGGELAAHGRGQFDRLGQMALFVILDRRDGCGDLSGQPFGGGGQRGGRLGLDCRAAGVQSGAIAVLAGGGQKPVEFVLSQHLIGDRLAGEVEIEGEFVGDAHRIISSSALPLLMTISPRAARSLAVLTSRDWASSTSFRRTAPMASMSSRIMEAAREDMLAKKNSRAPSEAPFMASAISRLSKFCNSVWMAADSRRVRSSKVNISALMRSALSRLTSSSAVMKRASVWRSKALKMSAICSWLSRRWVWLSVDMNSVRRVDSIFSRISFCTGSIESMRWTTSRASS